MNTPSSDRGAVIAMAIIMVGAVLALATAALLITRHERVQSSNFIQFTQDDATLTHATDRAIATARLLANAKDGTHALISNNKLTGTAGVDGEAYTIDFTNFNYLNTEVNPSLELLIILPARSQTITLTLNKNLKITSWTEAHSEEP